jgi:hypothetical protein
MGRTENVKEPVAFEAENERLQQRGDAKADANAAKRDLDTNAGNAKQDAKDAAYDAKSKAKETGRDAVDKAQDLKEDAKDTAASAKAKGRELKEDAKDTARDAKDSAQDKAGDAKEKAGEVLAQAQDKANDAKDRAGEVLDQAKNRAYDAKDKAGEVFDQAKGKAYDAKDAVASKAQDLKQRINRTQPSQRIAQARASLGNGRGYLIFFASAVAITALLIGSGSFFSRPQTRAERARAEVRATARDVKSSLFGEPTAYERAQASAADSLYHAKNRAGQKLGEAADLAKEKGIEAKDYAGQRAGAAADLAKEKAWEGADYAKEQALGSNVLHRAGKAFDAAKDHAENIGTEAYEFAKEAKDFIQEKGVEAKDFIQEKGMEAKDAAADKIHEVGKNARV